MDTHKHKRKHTKHTGTQTIMKAIKSNHPLTTDQPGYQQPLYHPVVVVTPLCRATVVTPSCQGSGSVETLRSSGPRPA